MRRVFGVTLFLGVVAAIVAGTCIGFATLMAPAEIKPIVAAKFEASEPHDVPVAPVEQKTQETVRSVLAAPAATPKISEEEPKRAKRHRVKKVFHVGRRRSPELRHYTFDRPQGQMYSSYGYGNYWR